MTTEEYGQPYWFDDPMPEFETDAGSPICENIQAITQMKLHIQCRAVPSYATRSYLASMGPDVMRVCHLPPDTGTKNDPIGSREITVFQFLKRAVEKFPELAELPFRKFHPMDLSQPKGAP